MNSGARIDLNSKKTLCSLCRVVLPYIRACITTQVHRKRVARQLRIRLNVPLPGDSRTHPTFFPAGNGLQLPPPRATRFIAAGSAFGHFLSRPLQVTLWQLKIYLAQRGMSFFKSHQSKPLHFIKSKIGLRAGFSGAQLASVTMNGLRTWSVWKSGV